MLFSTDLSFLDLVSASAAEFIRSNDLAALAPGRYELANGDYVNVSEYVTRDRGEASYEAHRDYADLQIEIRGAEIIEVASIQRLSEISAYDPAADSALYDGSERGERFLLTPGRFCLLMPADGHMPSVSADRGCGAHNKKAVFKIRVDHLAAMEKTAE